jgi:hypothetical protein
VTAKVAKIGQTGNGKKVKFWEYIHVGTTNGNYYDAASSEIISELNVIG